MIRSIGSFIAIFLLSISFLIGGTDPAPSAIASSRITVCPAGTMEESLQDLRDNFRIELVSVNILTNPKVIGPFLQTELDSGMLTDDHFPVDAIYIITLRQPKMVVVALSYEGCYQGSRAFQVSPFVQT